ncbi:hypothetical protein LCGC14_2478580, partial [marine sediment metagenome]
MGYFPFSGSASTTRSLVGIDADQAAPFTDSELLSLDNLRKILDAVEVLFRRLARQGIENNLNPCESVQDFIFVFV